MEFKAFATQEEVLGLEFSADLGLLPLGVRFMVRLCLSLSYLHQKESSLVS